MVIPKQDTFLCIADRSLSRLRGSPLPGAGCLGPGARVGGIILPDADAGALSLALVRLPSLVQLRRLWPTVRVWVVCAAGAWAGCVALVSRWRAYPAGCSCGGCAAGARLGRLRRWGLDWVLGLRLALVRISSGILLRRLWPPVRVWVAVPPGFELGARPLTCVGAFAQPGAAAAALAAGARLGWLCL